RWRVSLAEHFARPRATAVSPSARCAAVASEREVLVWSRARPAERAVLGFGALELRLADDCSWLAAKLREGTWRLRRIADPGALGMPRDTAADAADGLDVAAAEISFDRGVRRAAVSADGAFESIDLHSGQRERRWEHAAGLPWVGRFSTDERSFLGYEPRSATLLRWPLGPAAATQAEVLCERPPWGALLQLALSADGRWIAAAFGDGAVRLWRSDAGCLEAQAVLQHRRRITALSFSPDGRWLASGGLDDGVGLWSLDEPAARLLSGHEEVVNELAFSADGRFLLSASDDATARAWPLDSSSDPQVLRGHARDVERVAAGPDGLVTVGSDGAIRAWPLLEPSVRVERVHDAAIWTAVLDPSRRRLATSSDDGSVGIVELESNGWRRLRGHAAAVRELAFSSDGARLVTASMDGSARVWRVADGIELARLEGKGPLFAAAFSPTGTHVAVGGLEKRAWLWNLETGVVSELAHEGDRVVAVQFDPTGTALYTSDAYATAIWDVASGARRGRLVGHTGAALEPRFDPLGPRVFTASDDGTTAVFSTSDGRLLGSLGGHEHRTLGGVFSRDGRSLAVPSLDGTLSVWDTAHLSLRIRLLRHQGWVAAADFDSSGQRVVTASHDATARVWWLDDPGEPLVLRGHAGAVRFAGFDARDRVVSAGADGSVRVWDVPARLDAAALRARVREQSQLCLSVDERMELLAEDRSAAAMRARACSTTSR
ncbi:MAG TPA: WD40 repeat domain-containing protein, partial [Polyangiaceae bacterium]|nr:WD40 repeat domain-containing protein [Polyangiaceae bacterium]